MFNNSLTNFQAEEKVKEAEVLYQIDFFSILKQSLPTEILTPYLIFLSVSTCYYSHGFCGS